MCQKRATVNITVGPRTFRVDVCLRNLIEELNRNGIETVACCCGHGRYKTTVLVIEKGVVTDNVSGIVIPRKRNFYRMDANGYYFIPEVENGGG